MNRRKLFYGWVGIFVGLITTTVLALESPSSSSNVEGLENAIVKVANTTGKAVVSISTEHITKIKTPQRFYFNQPFGSGSPFDREDPFRRFFDDFFGETPGGLQEREFKRSGLGSGVIIDADGYILTNEHVVNDADKITVKLPDGRELKGEIKGKDSRSDLAVIKINAKNLPVASLGDSGSLKIGEWVVAIGNPFGFALDNSEPTVTTGVVSALRRSLGRAVSQNRDYSDLIQTDAAINPGNSGGPLVNLKGEVIGINVAIFSTSGGYQGVGFAIPINNAKKILSRLIEGKKIFYGWLGVTVQDMTEDMAKHIGLSEKSGALVVNTLEAGPAQNAGIKEGDVIKKFNGVPIKNVKDLINIVSMSEVSKKAGVLLVRDKKELNLSVLVGERPQEPEKVLEVKEKAVSWRGLKVEDLSSDLSRRFGIKEKKGVVVVDVESNSPADEAGINPGDVILEINKQPISSVLDYKKITTALKGDAMVKILRGYFLIKEKEK
ncbi:MAG: Do family serine endopeptidase [Candidatus Omnitrophota bacterium]|nr:Do family serine endopeptidase [Candidatus Omnitrophota bacterium]